MRAILIALLLALSVGAAEAQPQSAETVLWESVQNTKDPAELEAYLQAYPDGLFASLARIRLKKLERAAAAEERGQAEAADVSPAAGTTTVSVRMGRREGREHGWLGVNISTVTDRIASAFDLGIHRGVLVEGVTPSGPAAAAGIHAGDVILEFDGRAVGQAQDVQTLAASIAPDQQFDIVVRHSDQPFDGVIDALRNRAGKGNAAAMLLLGERYASGAGVAKDEAEAFSWYRKAAEKGEPEAMNTLGRMLKFGRGVEKNVQEAIKWHRRAAERGNADAMFALGELYRTGDGLEKNPEEAVSLFRKAAAKGNSKAMNNLGYMYSVGEGVLKDISEAFKWIRKAAEHGEPGAMYNTGVAYERGLSVARDPTQAAKWFRQAAELGETNAMESLAGMYEAGRGVAKDAAKAAEWRRRAAEKRGTKDASDLGLGELEALEKLE